MSDITGKSQKQPLPLYRAVFSFLMYPTHSQTELARLFNQTPSTINRAIFRLRDALSVGDKSVKKIFENLNINTNYKPMNRPDFNSFSKQVYEANKEKGFHDKTHSNKHHLTLIISELMEAVEADRKGRRAELVKFQYYMSKANDLEKDNAFPKYFNAYIKDTVEDELADAIIRLFDFAGAREYDLTDMAFSSKLSNNVLFTESVWEILFELIACEEEEAVFCTIKQIEELCKRMFIDLWKHVELKLKYNATRPFKHNKLY